MAVQAKFEATLRGNGRSVTKARVLLFMYLQDVGPVKPKLFIDYNLHIADRASLYRTLEMFKKLGIIEERIVGGKRIVELTDEYDSHHHHLTCIQCDASIAITTPQIESELERQGKHYGFEIKRHIIELEGLCPKCRITTPNTKMSGKSV